MFKWRKLGRIFNPIEVKDRSWLKEFSQAPSTLIRGDVVRIYFACRPAPDANGNYVSLSAFADFRRTNPTELLRISENPLLELGETGSFDEFGTYFTSVIPKGPDVLAYYVGYSRCESVPFTISIGAAVSRDGGDTFSKLGKGPILPLSPDEPFFLTVPKIRYFNDKYYLFYSSGKKWVAGQQRLEPVYQIRMAVSEDGINWNKVNRDLIPWKIEENECQASPDVIFYGRRYHMFFSYRYSVNYRCKEGGYRIGYASSDDLIHWTREDERAGITLSDEGWDSEMVSFPHVFELDGGLYMLYLGNQMGRCGFGLAKMESYQP